MSEGVIKFNLEHKEKKLSNISSSDFEELNSIRKKLFEQNMIGELPNGIGFGNISIRIKNNSFLISGSGTGGKENLTLSDYALVEDFSIEKNTVISIGETPASSESLTHAALYLENYAINAVIHIHKKDMFDKFKINNLCCLPKEILYGTVDLAKALSDCGKNNSNGIIATLGHEDGLYVWGVNLIDAYNILLNHRI